MHLLQRVGGSGRLSYSFGKGLSVLRSSQCASYPLPEREIGFEQEDTESRTRPSEKRPRLFLFVLCCYLFGGVFYVMPSGQPQPADYLIAACIGIAFIRGFVGRYHIRSLTAPLVLLLCWYFLVGAVNYTVFDDPFTVISPLFYLFNGLLMVFTIAVVRHDPMTAAVWIRRVLLLMLVTQLAAVYLIQTGLEGRAVGTFNDPNQLGYAVVLSLFAWLVTRYDGRITTGDVAAFLVTALLVLETQSRSASLGWIATAAASLMLMRSSRGVKLWVLVGCVGLVVAVEFFGLAFVSDGYLGDSLDALLARFAESGPDDSFGGRGYDRLWLYPSYLLFGAGEGAAYRFGTTHEIHSTWANLLFSYGVVGFALFVWVLVRVFSTARPYHLALFLGPAAYGIATYGARNSLFWVGLALVAGFSTFLQPHAMSVFGRATHPRARDRVGAGGTARGVARLHRTGTPRQTGTPRRYMHWYE